MRQLHHRPGRDRHNDLRRMERPDRRRGRHPTADRLDDRSSDPGPDVRVTTGPDLRIRFVVHSSGTEIGTAHLVDGRLIADDAVQEIIMGKALALDMTGLQAAEYFADWSNGYVGSSVVTGSDDDGDLAALLNRPTTTTGIDLAAAPIGTAIVAVDWDAEGPRARLVCDADGSADTEAILDVLSRDDRIGIVKLVLPAPNNELPIVAVADEVAELTTRFVVPTTLTPRSPASRILVPAEFQTCKPY